MRLHQWLLVCLLLLAGHSYALAPSDPDNIRLEQLTTHEGLSQNTVRCLLQDKRGFIWIGTLNGLNRYDGHKFIVYRPNGISDNRIRELHEDKQGLIWLKTAEGRFHCFDPEKETFLEYQPDSLQKSYDHFFETANGDIWLYGKANGSIQIQKQQQHFITHTYNKYPSVNFVFEHNGIWLGTTAGLFRLNNGQLVNTGKGNFIQAITDHQQVYFITKQNGIFTLTGQHFAAPENITNAALLPDSRLILGTQQSGVYIADLSSGQISPFLKDEITGHIDIITDQENDIWINNHTGFVWYYDKGKVTRLELIPAAVIRVIDDCRYSFSADNKHHTWITTYGGGLYCYDKVKNTLQHFSTSPNGLSSNYLLSILEDRAGLIWVGAEHTGLNKLVPQSLNVTHIFPEDESSGRYTINSIKTIYEDSYNRIWVSTRNGALYLYNNKLEKIRSLEHLLPGQCSNIYCITEDTKGYLWIGTKGNGLYIVHRDSLQQAARHFELPPGDTSSNANRLVYTVMQDKQQRMWIGTFGSGLHLATYKGGNNITFRQFFNSNEVPVYIRCLMQDKDNRIWAGTNNGILLFDPEILLKNKAAFTTYSPGSEIKAICEDHKGRIWIGTTGSGFSRFIPSTGTFTTYTTQQGLSHDIVNGMQEDLQGNLWISTENGLTRFNPEKSTFEIFYFANNTLGNLFSEASCFRTHNGQLLMGSLSGFYGFYPEQLKTVSADAPVILTGFNIAGSNQRVNASREITLEPGQKVFSIEFASLAFKNPQQNKYTYILEKYEDEWNTPAGYNIATYRNLPPGKYTFRVRGTNDDGSWSKQEASIHITVLPPFWRSNLAFGLYLIILTILILSIRYVTKRISRLQHAVELEQQLTEYKLNFFTNISHEFRTPLSLIMSAMESMMPGKHLHMMQKQVTYLMRLADQLLDFRKIQHKRMQLQVQQTDVIAFLKDICDGFSEQALQKQISLEFHSNVPSYMMWVDTNKLDKMLYNLLSNAHKFTPAGGHIVVQIKVDKELQIHVSDSGISIPPAKQHLVFQKFTQLNFSPTGTGIGLSLTKELAELHKGNIVFHNNPDAGVTFTITLPVENVYTAEEIVSADITTIPVIYIPEKEELPVPSSKYHLLIIEDNPDISEYLCTSLGRYFHIHTANNGREGLAQAIALAPDLVVCDVMLPEMNGLEIVQRIRSEFQTCHIPVILLTALSSGEHQLKGIEAGADAYITKPFSLRFLQTTIIRIIEQREKIRKRFANDPDFFTVHISENEADQQFLDKLNQIIDRNIDNSQFSVDEFAAAMKLGRTLFFKKIKGLTGYSPNEYIRLVRVKKASELLNTGDYTIAEVAYKVGMNDPFYFSKCFKAQFGVPPSVHLKKVKAG
jgi:signal transduction histidine kinase/ligand-binding sensor domain-containing protein/DNA-binding response OmpR family regulator